MGADQTTSYPPPPPREGRRVLSYMADLYKWLKRNQAIAGVGLISTQTESGKIFRLSDQQQSTPPNPFEVVRKTGLTGTINKGLIYSNPLTASGELVFDTEFLDTTVPVPGNFPMIKTDMVFADNATTAVLIKATYNSWELPDDGEVRCYSTGYVFDKDLCTFDASSLTMSTYIDDFTWPNAGGEQTKYFPVAIVQTADGEITTILQLITDDFIDPFAYLTSTQTPE